MNIGTIVVLVIVALVVIAIVLVMRRDKKNGKSICGGNCGSCASGCHHSGGCSSCGGCASHSKK